MSRLLDGAERSILLHGYNGSSIRRITQEVGVNVAAINYHFGTKKELFAEVFRRRLSAITQERSDALQTLERRAEYSPRDVIKAYFGTLFELCECVGQEGGVVIWKLLVSAPDILPIVGKSVEENYVVVRHHCAHVLASMIPDVSVEQLKWRLEVLERFVLCVLAGPSVCWASGSEDSTSTAAGQSCRALGDGLIDIILAGIQASGADRTG